MATKTKAKTATKKSVAHKPVAKHKPAPAKDKTKKKVEAHPKPALGRRIPDVQIFFVRRKCQPVGAAQLGFDKAARV